MFAEAREQKLEQLHASALRRFKHGGLLRGWGSWIELYREAEYRRYTEKMQKQVANTLRTPGLARGFGHWRDRWNRKVNAKRDAQLAQAAGVGRSVEERLTIVEARRDEALSTIEVRSQLPTRRWHTLWRTHRGCLR